MQYQPLPIPPQLAGAVESIFYLGDYTPEHEKERLVPDGRISLVIELDNQPRYVVESAQQTVRILCQGAWLSGFHDTSMVFTTPANTKLIAVRFFPSGLFAFTESNLETYVNQVVSASAVFGASIALLRERLMAQAVQLPEKPEQMLETVVDWLEQQQTRFQDAAVQSTITRLLEDPSADSLKQALDAQPYSHKHFLKLFTEHTGSTPKRLQRVLRFNQVFQHIQQNEKMSWSSISHDCGYYDQAHFIKEFKAFSGINPKAYLAIETDRQNFFSER